MSHRLTSGMDKYSKPRQALGRSAAWRQRWRGRPPGRVSARAQWGRPQRVRPSLRGELAEEAGLLQLAQVARFGEVLGPRRARRRHVLQVDQRLDRLEAGVGS